MQVFESVLYIFNRKLLKLSITDTKSLWIKFFLSLLNSYNNLFMEFYINGIFVYFTLFAFSKFL